MSARRRAVHLRDDHLERRGSLAGVFTQGLPDFVVRRPGLSTPRPFRAPQNRNPSKTQFDFCNTRLGPFLDLQTVIIRELPAQHDDQIDHRPDAKPT